MLLARWSPTIITLPALIEMNIGTEAEPIIVTIAFSAVMSIAVIGLYLAFAIPIWQRWRCGDAFESGTWNIGSHWRWMAPSRSPRSRSYRSTC